MAIPNNYIDKITKDGDSRPICPPAEHVRVENDNFEGESLDDVLDEISESIGEAGKGSVNAVKVGSTPYTPDGDGVVDLSTPFGGKVDKVTGKGLSSNDYTTAEKTKLAGIAEGATANMGTVQTVSVNGGTPVQPVNGNVDLIIEAGAQGPKGEKGDTVVLDTEGLPVFTIVNDLTTGGASDALSAEMGRRLRLGKGTFAAAWARSKADNVPFAWIWDETVDNEAICKLIWHVGSSNFIDAIGASVNVDYAAPAAPTFSETTGTTVPKNTTLTITPASGAVLYYSTDGVNYTAAASAVSLTLSTAGNVTISAYCATNGGNSSTASITLTVAGTAVPTLTASGEIARGGNVTITGDKDGTLHYKVGSAAYVDVVGDGVNAPTATVQITGTTTIEAYNTIDGDDSEHVTGNYTMAALAAPTFSEADGTELPSGGEDIVITASAGTGIKYTTDGTDPASSGTATTVAALTATVNVAARTTIKAVAYDSYGSSAIAQAEYTIAVPKIVVTASAATTMSLGDSGLTALTINEGTTEFTIDDINTLAGTSYASFADHTFASLSFGSSAAITSFRGGGVKIRTLTKALSAARSLSYFDGVTVDGGDLERAFNTASFDISGGYCKISGSTNNLKDTFSYASGFAEIDLSELDTSSATGSISFTGIFQTANKCKKISIGNFTNVNATDGGMGTYKTMWNGCAITDLWCHATTPPAVHATDDYNIWKLLATKRGTNVTIHVPTGTLNAYKTAWGIDTEVNWSEF